MTDIILIRWPLVFTFRQWFVFDMTVFFCSTSGRRDAGGAIHFVSLCSVRRSGEHRLQFSPCLAVSLSRARLACSMATGAGQRHRRSKCFVWRSKHARNHRSVPSLSACHRAGVRSKAGRGKHAADPLVRGVTLQNTGRLALFLRSGTGLNRTGEPDRKHRRA
jgi:hypothetical protein